MFAYVYKIENLVNNNCYIGSTVSLKVRWKAHLRSLEENRHHCRHLQAGWNKYKKENFKFEILEELVFENNQKLIEREQFWLDSFSVNLKYNSAPRAGTNYGCKHSKEANLKKSERQRGIVRTEESKKWLSEMRKGPGNPMYGKQISLEHKKAISKANKGMSRHTEEGKKRIAFAVSLRMKGKLPHNKGKKRILDIETGKYKYVAQQLQ